jgi:hypothetical protein
MSELGGHTTSVPLRRGESHECLTVASPAGQARVTVLFTRMIAPGTFRAIPSHAGSKRLSNWEQPLPLSETAAHDLAYKKSAECLTTLRRGKHLTTNMTKLRAIAPSNAKPSRLCRPLSNRGVGSFRRDSAAIKIHARKMIPVQCQPFERNFHGRCKNQCRPRALSVSKGPKTNR